METAQSTPGSREENLAVAEELIDDARAAANTAHARRREELARVPGLRAVLEEARRACAEAKAAFDARWPQGRDGVNGTLNRLKKRLEDVSRELEGSRRKLAAAGMFAFSRRKELRETVAAKEGTAARLRTDLQKVQSDWQACERDWKPVDAAQRAVSEAEFALEQAENRAEALLQEQTEADERLKEARDTKARILDGTYSGPDLTILSERSPDSVLAGHVFHVLEGFRRYAGPEKLRALDPVLDKLPGHRLRSLPDDLLVPGGRVFRIGSGSTAKYGTQGASKPIPYEDWDTWRRVILGVLVTSPRPLTPLEIQKQEEDLEDLSIADITGHCQALVQEGKASSPAPNTYWYS